MLLQTASEESFPIILIFIIAMFILLDLIFFITAMRVVPEYQRLAVFRLGRFVRIAGPGVVLLIPFIDLGARVDLREKVQRYEADKATTQDNQSIVVDWLWSYQVVDPAKCVLNVQNLDESARELATTVLHSIIGGMMYNDTLIGRDYIRTELQTRLNKAIQNWGIDVRQIELLELKRG